MNSVTKIATDIRSWMGLSTVTKTRRKSGYGVGIGAEVVEVLERRRMLASFSILSSTFSGNGHSATYEYPVPDAPPIVVPHQAEFNMTTISPAKTLGPGLVEYLQNPHKGDPNRGDVTAIMDTNESSFLLDVALPSLSALVSSPRLEGAFYERGTSNLRLKIVPSPGSNEIDKTPVTIRIAYNDFKLIALDGKIYSGGEKIDAKIGDTLTFSGSYSQTSRSNARTGGVIKISIVTLNVTTIDNEYSAPSKDFGGYLPGVNLDVPLKVEFSQPDLVVAIKWQVAGGASDSQKLPVAVYGGSGSFNYNVGKLSPGTHKFTVSLVGAKNATLQTFDGLIHMVNQLTFKLQAEEGQKKVDDINARFFKDIKPSFITFDGTVGKLPKYYDDLVHVNLPDGSPPISPGVTDKAGFHFQFKYDPSNQPVGTTLAHLFISAQSAEAHFGAMAGKLLIVKAPEWLKSGNPKFDSSTGNYVWTNATAALLKMKAPSPKTGNEWLDEALDGAYETSASLTAKINVSAPLSTDDKITYDGTSLHLNARVLGKSIWDSTYEAKNLAYDGTLDSKTLMPESWGFHLIQPYSKDFDLFDKSITIDALPNIPSWITSAELTFSIKVTGKLTIDGGLMFATADNQVKLIEGAGSSGTFLKLTGTLKATPSAQVDIEVLGGYLLKGKGWIEVPAALQITGTARFSGTLTKAELTSGNIDAKLTLSYSVTAKVTVLKSKNVLNYASETIKLTEIKLFSISQSSH